MATFTAALLTLLASGVWAQSSAAPAGPATSAAGSAAPASGSGAASGGDEGSLNWLLIKGLLWAWVALVGGTMIYCVVLHCVAYLRTVACLNHDKQRYFSRPNAYHSIFRKHLVDAPLLRKRHHREFKLSSAVNVGTLPNRAQMLFLVLYVGASVLLTVWDIDWSQQRRVIYGMLIERTGMLAIMNMVPLFLLAGRNNPLLQLTGITFDTFNLVHRWLGRIVVLEALLHTLFYLMRKVPRDGWASFQSSLSTSQFILSGFIGAVAFTAILFQSPGAIRHAFYETFLVGHQLIAALALGAVWVHLSSEKYRYQLAIIKGTLAIWAAERGIRVARIIWRNIGRGGTTAEVEALPGEAVRVTVRLARPWHFNTGAHAYLYMPRLGWWTSHPFSIAWSSDSMDLATKNKSMTMLDPEKAYDMGPTSQSTASMSSTDILANNAPQSISFIIRSRTGFTEKLYRKAEAAPNGRFTSKCFLEGPYGHQTLHSYGTILLFAAGVGVTHQVPHVRDLVTGHANGTVAARKVVLVWIIQKPEHLEWIRPWMTSILSLPRRKEVLKVLLFVTRPKNNREIQSPSSSVQMYPGKPNISAIVDQEIAGAIGAVGVSVCGVGALADEVRKSCRKWMGKVNVDFSEESFSW